jgi:hypothetical protein
MALAFGCERSPADEAEASAIGFVVDDGVEYAFFDPSQGLTQANSLEDVPLEQRAAVVIVADEAGQNPHETVHVADLLAAQPGQKAQARPMSRRQHFQHARAAQNAGGLAGRVKFMAQEVSQLDPRSDRSAASREARHKLDKLVPRETSPESP